MQRIVLEYLWMWIAALLNIVLYIPMALVIKGVVVFDGVKICFTSKKERIDMDLAIPQSARLSQSVAKQMLLCVMLLLHAQSTTVTDFHATVSYPVIYTITVLPIAVVRWITFQSPQTVVPFPATVFADVLYAASGLFNVILFSTTRSSLLPHIEGDIALHHLHFQSSSPLSQSSGPTHSSLIYSPGGTGGFRGGITPVVVRMRAISIASESANAELGQLSSDNGNYCTDDV